MTATDPISDSPRAKKTTDSNIDMTTASTRAPLTTGDTWQDVKLAVQSISPIDDIKTVPCMRNSLLAGIGGGVGVGFIRAMNTKPLNAGHWAIGTFALVSIASWNVCTSNMKREEARMRLIREQFPQRRRQREPEKPAQA